MTESKAEKSCSIHAAAGPTSFQMPFSPRACPCSHPVSLCPSAAELGSASFWKVTVFGAGRGWAGLLASLGFAWQVYPLLLTLALPLPLERPRMSRTDSEGQGGGRSRS